MLTIYPYVDILFYKKRGVEIAVIFEKYKPLADYVAALLGPHTEVVLHDFSDLDHSIVYIVNNQLTGRVVGDTATDLLLDFLTNKESEGNDFLTNYSSMSKSNKLLHSSTYFIKNSQGKLIGALCTNTDLTIYNDALKAIKTFIPNATITNQTTDEPNNEIKETFYESPEKMTLHKIEIELNKLSIPPERMTSDEKAAIVGRLYKMGIFKLKGSVQKTAHKLKTSEASIYRYIRAYKESVSN